MLVVEDVHWADHPTRDLLSFLVRNLRHAGVLLVVTFRSAELDRSHPLRPLLAELGRMPRGHPDGAAQTVARPGRGAAGGHLGPAAGTGGGAAVYERGGGNPLFTEALVNADGTVSPGVPWSLRDLLLGAVKELPEQTQQVLRAAAVGGVRVGHALLAAVTGLDDAALAASLRSAVDANVVVADADSYAFRHNLIRQAVREDLLPGERARAERTFAEALEADPALGRRRHSRGSACAALARRERALSERCARPGPRRPTAASRLRRRRAAADAGTGARLWDRVPPPRNTPAPTGPG